MNNAAKPRRWTIKDVKYGAQSTGKESLVEVIEASAYDAIEAELDKVKRKLEGQYKLNNKRTAQLEIERRKVEKLREQRDKWSSMCAGYSMTWRAQVHEREDAELEAIDEGRE